MTVSADMCRAARLPPGLLAAAMEAGVNLRRWIDGDGPGLQGA